MARSTRARITWLIVFIILAIGLIWFLSNRGKLSRLLLPEVTKITLLQVDIHNDTAFIRIHAIAENKSPYKLSIDSLLCDVSLAGIPLVSESQRLDLVQEKGQSDTIVFAVRIPVSHTRKTIQQLQDQDFTGLSLEATIVYNTKFGKLRINLSKEKTIEVPIPPQLKIVRTERKKLRLLKKEVDVDLFLQITNEGKNLDLKITDLNYELTLGKDLHAKGKFGRDITVKPRSSLLLRFPLEFKMEQPLTTIFKTWNDEDRVPFVLVLSGFLESPKMKHIPIELRGSGYTELVKEKRVKAEKKRKRKKKRDEREMKRDQRRNNDS